ncbi:hypothetical protein MalM25_31980 [Planctomycetes bacterium MalM25]|nr:hypothetical protein MalM25_31980 [Planctomycetes bacterium MalM25]
MLWLILLLPVVAVLMVLATQVDDWSRDLTTNRAHTAPGAKQEPWQTHGATLEAIAEAAAELARRDAKWRLADEKPLPDDSPLPPLLNGPPSATHHFVRTTGLMRYQDDIWLLVTDQGDGTLRFDAESRSRVGKGDLGQNPRNLAELERLLLQTLDQ